MCQSMIVLLCRYFTPLYLSSCLSWTVWNCFIAYIWLPDFLLSVPKHFFNLHSSYCIYLQYAFGFYMFINIFSVCCNILPKCLEIILFNLKTTFKC